jgi:hypothetical protein
VFLGLAIPSPKVFRFAPLACSRVLISSVFGSPHIQFPSIIKYPFVALINELFGQPFGAYSRHSEP